MTYAPMKVNSDGFVGATAKSNCLSSWKDPSLPVLQAWNEGWSRSARRAMADGSREEEQSDPRPFEAVLASPEDFQSCVC